MNQLDILCYQINTSRARNGLYLLESLDKEVPYTLSDITGSLLPDHKVLFLMTQLAYIVKHGNIQLVYTRSFIPVD